MNIKPFVKWAGGKSQILPDIRKKYPQQLGSSITKYCEPFVGGGAVLFDIILNNDIEEILINDVNKELINSYIQIKFNLDILLMELFKIQNRYWNMSTEKRKEFYYEKRERFNFLKINSDKDVNIEKAVLFIFLNKTCFNGLFRVNKNGLFNVPVGSYKKPVICDSDNLTDISRLLKKVDIRCGDYKNTIDFIDEKTFVYIDPPYRPLSATASFTAYTEMSFNDDEQSALKKFADDIDRKGAKFIVSNSDPKNNDETDNFFDDLYKSYYIERVTAKRMINCNGESRGDISELLISNY